MFQNDVRTMFCTLCGNEQPISVIGNSRLPNKAIENRWCIKCKKVTPHKNILFYEKNFQQNKKKNIPRDCSMIRGIKTPSKKRLFIKCTTADGFIIEFKTVGEAADFLILNQLSSTDTRKYVKTRIDKVLQHKAQSLYGLKFCSVFAGINGYCDEPEAFCKQKGAYLGKHDITQHNCEQKQCQNFVKV